MVRVSPSTLATSCRPRPSPKKGGEGGGAAPVPAEQEAPRESWGWQPFLPLSAALGLAGRVKDPRSERNVHFLNCLNN
uniref:Macaca fascicularis brain cDNA clone: QflA-10051, similar to human mitogen-activated protein kinase 4 (MAPK4), mRNA, RefSeq: NM_002747.2 n=1 Tax=Macaca fascicularis TaxID=9541 RepID=I7GKE6_MACFA|nr:unnamed protein product [Macaca fascicularis]